MLPKALLHARDQPLDPGQLRELRLGGGVIKASESQCGSNVMVTRIYSRKPKFNFAF